MPVNRNVAQPIDSLISRSVDGSGRVRIGKQFANQTVQLSILSNPGDDIPVYFIRHGDKAGDRLDISSNGLQHLLEDHCIALDWNTGGRTAAELFREEGGTSAVTDIETFQTLAREGGLVFATYPGLFKDRPEWAMLGYVPAGTRIKTDTYENASGEQKRYNIIEPTEFMEVSEENEPLLWETDAQPARGTIRRWRKHADEVREVWTERR